MLRFRNTFTTITIFLLIFLWVYTAIHKLVNIEYNVAVLKRSPFLNSFSHVLAVVIPLAELIAAGLLLSTLTRQKGLYMSLILLLIFSLYIITAMLFASWLPCTCGGIIESLTWNQHLVFNSTFIIATALSIKYNSLNALQSGSSRKPVTE